MSDTQKLRKPKWFAFHPDAWFGGTRGMSLAAKGAYLNLLNHQFSKGSIPSDDIIICRIIGAFLDEWHEVKEEVLAKFERLDDGSLVNYRMGIERDERFRRMNPGAFPSCQDYDSRRREASYVISKSGLREMVFSQSDHRCVHCGTSERLTVDHIVPVAMGGGDGIENLQALCRSCNSRKGARLEHQTATSL